MVTPFCFPLTLSYTQTDVSPMRNVLRLAGTGLLYRLVVGLLAFWPPPSDPGPDLLEEARGSAGVGVPAPLFALLSSHCWRGLRG